MIISMNGVISIVYLLKLLPKVFEINRYWFFVILRYSTRLHAFKTLKKDVCT